MFHSACALLFSLGVKERSHFAMIEYLKEKFKNEGKIYRFLSILDSYRITKHGIQYRGDFYSRVDAEEAIKDAENFLKYADFVEGFDFPWFDKHTGKDVRCSKG